MELHFKLCFIQKSSHSTWPHFLFTWTKAKCLRLFSLCLSQVSNVYWEDLPFIPYILNLPQGTLHSISTEYLLEIFKRMLINMNLYLQDFRCLKEYQLHLKEWNFVFKDQSYSYWWNPLVKSTERLLLTMASLSSLHFQARCQTFY